MKKKKNLTSRWDLRAEEAKIKRPLKRLNVLPNIPGIVPSERKNLVWKSFKYMLFQKEGKKILSYILKRPFYHGWNYFASIGKKKRYLREGDFFLYGLPSLQEFEKRWKKENALLILGFSYCQKPFECPSGRFTDKCALDVSDLVCQQCDIGKILHHLPKEKVIPLMIPTVHYIGEKVFEIQEKNKGKDILFLITACELTLEMFGDFGNMVKIPGIGVRLDGRICNTMEAFILSERGIKPGLTVLTNPTYEKVLNMLLSDAFDGKVCSPPVQKGEDGEMSNKWSSNTLSKEEDK